MTRRKALSLLLLLAACAWAEAPLRQLPYDDPAYPLLERAYARGWVRYLPQIRPYTEAQALELLSEAVAYLAAHPSSATETAKAQLRELRSRLSGSSRHVLGLRWGEGSEASVDFPVAFQTNLRANDPSDAFVSLRPGLDVRASVSEKLYLSLDVAYGASLATWETAPFGRFDFPQIEDYAVYSFYLSRGERGFAGRDQLGILHKPGETDLFFWMNLLSQNTVDFGLGTLSLGRGALSWGPSPLANLSLSATAKPYDYLQLQIPLGARATYVWATGFLQDYYGTGLRASVDKLLNTHRIEVQATNWLMFAVYESIVYSKRFEISYLNPLSVYAVAEVQGGDYDNKLGGADLVLRFAPVKLYGSFYVDDWDFGHVFDPFYYHNEWAGIIGVELYDLLPNLSINLEYIVLSHWMYTHRMDLSDEENNLNRYKHYGSHLGHFLNPNSHMVYLDLDYDVSTALALGITTWFTQNGGGGYGTYDRGDIDTPPDWSFEETLPSWPENVFLDGTVESVFDVTLSAEYRMPKQRLRFGGSYSLQYTHNVGKIEGVNRWDHIVEIDIGWMVD